jgi:aryl-alcohol dehydrogenase-like predicted oxidoreductase
MQWTDAAGARQAGEMEFTHLGRSGLTVSRLCLGTMNFGPLTSEADAHAIMDSAHDYGINFFDTANAYGLRSAGTSGHGEGKGSTEQIIGRWFAQGGGRRERTVLATKVYGDMGDWPNEGKLSALNIRRALDASLTRLQTDYVDLYQFHHIDRATPWDEIWQAIDVAVTAGKILYVGSSNFAGWHIAEAQESAKRHNLIGLSSEQSLYNLINRDIELEVIPAAEHYGLGLIPWSPLHGGLLGGVLRKERDGKRRLEGRASATVEAKRQQIEAYEDFAAELGHEPGDIALAWLLHQGAVTAPIVGPRIQEQLDAAVRALDVDLDEKALARLDEIFPGYRTAPEHYAW